MNNSVGPILFRTRQFLSSSSLLSLQNKTRIIGFNGKSDLINHNQSRYFCSESDDKRRAKKAIEIDPSRDRRIPVELETSIQYMNSDAFKETYKDYKIWELFRRNFKGQFSSSMPRISCIENGFVKTSNPCVVCRDRYLVLHYKNIKLLEHFISPHTGYVYPNTILCLCADQYEKLCVAVTLAKNYGLIDFETPSRHYDYDEHYSPEKIPENFLE